MPQGVYRVEDHIEGSFESLLVARAASRWPRGHKPAVQPYRETRTFADYAFGGNAT